MVSRSSRALARWLAIALVVAVVAAIFPAGAGAANGGIFPDADAGAYCSESHGWWTEGLGADPTTTARHIHVGVCLDAARGMNGAIAVSGTLTYTARVVTLRSPDVPDWVGASWFSDHGQSSEIFVRDIAQYEVASATPDERVYLVPVSISTSTAKDGGLVELRTRANIAHYSDLGTRQFTTNNMQLYLNNGKTPAFYRARANPIARGWYGGGAAKDPEYANAELTNYTDLFAGDLSAPRPVLAGVVGLKLKTDNGSTHDAEHFPVQTRLIVDPDFHHGQPGWTVCTYTGNVSKTCNLDTTQLANGRHAIFIELREYNADGEARGQLRVEVEVNNP